MILTETEIQNRPAREVGFCTRLRKSIPLRMSRIGVDQRLMKELTSEAVCCVGTGISVCVIYLARHSVNVAGGLDQSIRLRFSRAEDS